MWERKRAGGTPGNFPQRPLTRRERWAAMRQGRDKGKKTEAGGKMWEAEPWECRKKKAAARPLE